MRPDFGKIETQVNGITLSCCASAPGLSLHDLVMIFERAKAHAAPGDELAGDPTKWPDVRGVSAVVEAVLAAIYDKE